MPVRVRAGEAAGAAGRSSPAAAAAGHTEAALFVGDRAMFLGVGLVLLCHADNRTDPVHGHISRSTPVLSMA